MVDKTGGLSLYPVLFQPSVKRDGSVYAGNYYIDSLWFRFQRGLPRKIGGYKLLQGGLPNIVRDTYVIPVNPNFNVYLGDYQSLKYFTIDENGNNLSVSLTDRTPAGFVANVNNIWQFATMTSGSTGQSLLIAHAAPNLASINSDVETAVYYGQANSNALLQPTGFTASGGIMVIGGFLFMFGSNGKIIISNENDPTTALATVYLPTQKIVAGMPTRGGTASPAGLLWSLDSVIRVTRTAAPVNFIFDTVTDQSSILSSSSIIQYDSRYFWAGTDRFLMYNGIVQEVPNQLNLNYFFQNMNYSQRQKAWTSKVTQFGEVWYFYPFGANTECTNAVMYNVRENLWYDTPVSRSSGYFEQTFSDPIWCDNVPDGNGQYSVWWHEVGYDKNINGTLTPIDAYIKTGDIAWAAIGPQGTWTGTDRWVDLQRVEPDFWQQVGDITLTIDGTEYAQGGTLTPATYTLSAGLTKLDLREQRRYMTLKFETNTLGGFFELGQLLLSFRIGDARA